MFVLVLYLGLNLPAIIVGDFNNKDSCLKFAKERIAVVNSEMIIKGVCLKKDEV